MPDNKDKQGTQDDIRIDKNDASEVAFVAELFNVSTNEVLLAIQKAKTDLREDVYRILEDSMNDSDDE